MARSRTGRRTGRRVSDMRLSPLLAFAGVISRASGASPVTLPTSEWLGNDGNWSTVEISMGDPAQTLNVLAGTSISEIWAVSSGGCSSGDSSCSKARGGLYSQSASSKWSDLGQWQLGLKYLGFGGNGDFGHDEVSVKGKLSGADLKMDDAVVSLVNTTDFYLGYFGLGISQGKFGDQVTNSPLKQAVRPDGIIPSASYGYTAGAHYRNVPASVTLGGYDAARLADHTIDFVLDKENPIPRTKIRGIQVEPAAGVDRPSTWASTVNTLSTWSSPFTAIFDSSTPYLWLPRSICDQFAAALDLEYNSTFNLYTASNDKYNEYMKEKAFDFTFTLASSNNTDDGGNPTTSSGIVNITIPSRAFMSTLAPSFNEDVIKSDSLPVRYFSMRPVEDNSTLIIGRSFLQEAFLITDYDRQIFSVHQAQFPQNPDDSAHIISITPPDGADSGSPTETATSAARSADEGSTMSKGGAAGIIIGVILTGTLLLAGVWIWLRRKQPAKPPAENEEERDIIPAPTPSTDKFSTASLTNIVNHSQQEPEPEPEPSRLSRIMNKVANKREKNKSMDKGAPIEAPDNQVYELSAARPPVELDGDTVDSDDFWIIDHEVGLGLDEDAYPLSQYEQTRIKMDRQLAGPVPEYTPGDWGLELPQDKKDQPPTGPVAPTPEEPDIVSPLSPDAARARSGVSNHPSPISTREAWSPNVPQSPSPVDTTVGPKFPAPVLSRGNTFRESSSLDTAIATRSNSIPTSTFSTENNGVKIQRTPLTFDKAVCLGEIPENVQLPGQEAKEGSPAPSSFKFVPPTFHPSNDPNEDTLGSNFTIEEARHAEVDEAYNTAPPFSASGEDELSPKFYARWSNLNSPYGAETMPIPQTPTSPPRRTDRINPGFDLVHVPQIPERRYSWGSVGGH